MRRESEARWKDKNFVNPNYRSVGYIFAMPDIPKGDPFALDAHMADPEAPGLIPDFTVPEEWPCDNTAYAPSLESLLSESDFFMDSEAERETVNEIN